MSFLTFNLYSEYICRAEHTDSGIKVNGIVNNNLRFSDDAELVASRPENRFLLLDSVTFIRNEYELEHNTKETKCMMVSKQYVIHQ